MRQRLFKILRRLGIGFLILMSVLLLWAWWGRPLEDLVERALSGRLDAEVTLGELSLDLPRGFRLLDLSVRRSDAPDAEPFLEVPEIAIGMASLINGPITAVRVQSPRLVATEDADGNLDLAALLRPSRPEVVLPQIQVFDGVLEWRGEGPRTQVMSRILAPDQPLRLSLPRCEVLPSVLPGTWTLRGDLVAMDHGEFLLEGRGVVGGPVELELSLPRGRPMDLDEAGLRSRLGQVVLDWLDRNQVHGRVMGSLRLGLEPGRPLERHLALELLDCEITPDAFPVPMDRVRGAVSWSGAELVLGEILARHGRTTVDLNGALSSLFGPGTLTLNLNVRDGSLTPSVRGALDRIPGMSRFLEALKVEGLCHGEVRLTIGPDHHLESTLDLRVQDGKVVFVGFAPQEEGEARRGFPLPVRNIQGAVTKTVTGLHFEHLGGRTDSGARVSATGHFEQEGEELVGSLFLQAQDLLLDDAFRQACTQLGGPDADLAFRRHGFAGRVDLELDLRLGKGGVVEWGVDLLPREMTIRTELFPFPVMVDAGVVRIRDGKVDLVELRARHAEGSNPVRFTLNGTAEVAQGGRFDLTVMGRRLALDADLAEAIGAAGLDPVRDAWRRLGPQGTLDLDLGVRRDTEGAPWSLAGTVSSAGVDLQLPRWTVPLTGMRGNLELNWVEGGDFRCSTVGPGLVGELLGGEVQVKAGYSTDGTGDMEVRGLRLRVRETQDSQTGSVLAALETLEPAAAELLQELRPSGRIRTLVRLQCQADRWLVDTVEVGPDLPPNTDSSAAQGLSVHLAPSRSRVLWNGGVLRGSPDSGRWKFDRVTASVGEAVVVLSEGLLRISPEGLTLDCKARVGALPLDAFLFATLPAEQRGLLSKLETVGLTHTNLEELHLFIPSGESLPTVLDVAAEVELSACGLRRGNGLRDLNGRLGVEIHRKAGVTTATGTLRGGNGRVGELPFHAIEADLEMEGETLRVDRLAAEFAGGRLDPQENHWTFPLDGVTPYEGEFLLRGLQLDRIFGVGNPRTRGWEGQVDVDLRFRGTGASLSRLEAVGSAQVRNGQLWKIPVFDRLYSLGISRILGQSEPPTFHTGNVTLAMKSGVIHVHELRLVGPALELAGEGAFGPSGLDLHFYPNVVVDLPWVDIPLLGSLVAGLFSLVERETLSFRFEGPYQNPRVRWDPVSVRPRSDFAQGLDRPRMADPPPLLSRERF